MFIVLNINIYIKKKLKQCLKIVKLILISYTQYKYSKFHDVGSKP